VTQLWLARVPQHLKEFLLQWVEDGKTENQIDSHLWRLLALGTPAWVLCCLFKRLVLRYLPQAERDYTGRYDARPTH